MKGDEAKSPAYMESRERRTAGPGADQGAWAEADWSERLAVARCPACRHELVARVRGGVAGFSCGCPLGL